MMRDVCMMEDEVLVSYDVVSLFTSVPIGEAVKVIQEMLHDDEDLVVRTPLSPDRIGELLELCLRSTYFSYNGEFYEQSEGAAMGSPVSAIVANLYQTVCLLTAAQFPKIDPADYSSYTRLKCVTARMVRFINNYHARKETNTQRSRHLI